MSCALDVHVFDLVCAHLQKICLETRKTRQALFGIVQGSRFKSLREESAKFIQGVSNRDGQLLILVDLNKLLSDDEWEEITNI